MFNAASKLYFAVAGGAVMVGLAYAVGTGDRVGFTALVFAGLTAFALGVAVFALTPGEPEVVDAGEPEERRPADTTDVPRPSGWPLLGALAITAVAVGVATEATFIALGVALALVAGFAWFGQVWREHPSWTPAMTERLHDRFVVPIGLPGTIVILAGIGVISLAKVMLAISAEAAPLIGMLIAFAILAGFQLVSSRSLGRRALTALAATSAGLVVAAGVAGAVKGERKFAHHEPESQYRLAAEDIEFDKDQLDFPAKTKVKLEFVNHDDVQHNFSLLRDEGGEELFKGEIITEGEFTYSFTTPEAGTYFFQCDVHPVQMQGKVEVSIEASEPPEPGGKMPAGPTEEH